MSVRRGGDTQAGGDPQNAVTVGPGNAEALYGRADALGDRVTSFEIGVRQEQRQLLATVARRGVGVAGIFLQDEGYMTEHRVALGVPVGVVDGLEIVDVEHDQADRMVVAANLLDLGIEQLLEAATIRETGQFVRDRLATNLKMELMFSSASAASAASDRRTSRSSSENGRPRRATEITPWAR